MREIETEQSLLHWAKKAKKGEKALYYNGLLMMDRQRYFMNGGLAENQPERLKAAKFAWHLYMDGIVTLVQKKKDAYKYDYIAVKR